MNRRVLVLIGVAAILPAWPCASAEQLSVMDFFVAHGSLKPPVRSGLNQRPVDGVIDGYVRVQDNPARPHYGHFVNKAGRVKFAGVNISPSAARATAKAHHSAWPRTPAEAKETADRLADLGINGVRVMRLINPAPVGLLNSEGTALDPSASAVFAEFVRALRARSVYLTISFWNGDDDFVPCRSVNGSQQPEVEKMYIAPWLVVLALSQPAADSSLVCPLTVRADEWTHEELVAYCRHSSVPHFV